MAKSVYERFGASNLAGSDQTIRRYTVKVGDTPALIAAACFPDADFSSELWRQIVEAQTPPVDDLDAIAIGSVWVIPTITPTT